MGNFGGRCYLVAPEHVRGLAPDENFITRPKIQEGLKQLREASRAKDYIDLSMQEVPEAELRASIGLPASDDPYNPYDQDEEPLSNVAEPPTDAPPVAELAPEPQAQPMDALTDGEDLAHRH